MTLKHCKGCDEDKELTEFYIRKSGRYVGKPSSICKKCDNVNSAKWRKVNPEKAAMNSRAWEKANPEKVKASHRTGYKTNSVKIQARNKAWRKNNPEKVKLSRHAWYITNNEKLRKLGRDYHYQHGSTSMFENKSSSAYLGCVIAETILSHEFPGFKRMPYGNPGYDYDCPKGFKIDVKSSCRRHPKRGNDTWGFQIGYNKVANYFLFLAFGNRDEQLVPEHVWLVPGDVVNNKSAQSITDSPESLAKWSQYERSLTNVLECCNALKGEIKK